MHQALNLIRTSITKMWTLSISARAVSAPIPLDSTTVFCIRGVAEPTRKANIRLSFVGLTACADRGGGVARLEVLGEELPLKGVALRATHCRQGEEDWDGKVEK
jgi:hypothetical protein